MKLRAIRLKEFRRFGEPVTVEGLSGSLNVLAAPNEDGKSTLFDAVRTVISEKYNAGAKTNKMKQIQPYAGGAPLIEVDFDLGGRGYRLRKQFVKRPDAVLTDRETGRDIARKDDVEDWIRDNLRSRLPFGLFWVAQQASLTPVLTEKNSTEHIPTLRSAVEAEVGAIAGGAVRDKVRKSVTEELDGLITTRGARKNGAYDQALRARDGIVEKLETARQRRAEAEGRLERLEVLRDERQAIVSSPDHTALAARIERAKSSVTEAVNANTQLRGARKEQEASEHQLTAVTQQLTDFDARACDHLELTKAQDTANAKLAALSGEAREAETVLQAAGAKQKELDKQLASLRESEKAALHAEQRNLLVEGITQREAVLGDARTVTSRIDETKQFLIREQVTADVVQTLQQIMGDVAALDLRAQQQTPKVTVRYDEGAEGRVRANGQVLAGNMARPVTEITEFVIQGVGRLVVDPGDRPGRNDDEADLAALKEQRDTLMDQLGVVSLKEAQKRAAGREAQASTLLLDQKRLKDMAPDGIEALESALGAEQARLDALTSAAAAAADQSVVVRRRDAIVLDIAALEPSLAKQARAVDGARQAFHELQIREAAEKKDVANRTDRLDALTKSLDQDAARNPIGRDANRSALAGAVEVSKKRLGEATRDVSGWLDAYVNDEVLGTRKTKLAEVEKEAAASREALQKIDQERGEIDAVLRETMQDGIDEVIGELEGSLELAEKGVAFHERRIAGLKLLATTLDEVANETREKYTQPIVDRMGPYIEAVFPGASLSFTEQFSAAGILRNGASEQFSDISLGTQEQISVLIRLGFARLFADRDQPLPLILDDALVYSDDERIERMFNALRLASEQHQVLILTCRTRAFEGLGGNRVSIQTCMFG